MMPSQFEMIEHSRTRQREIMQAIARERLADQVHSLGRASSRPTSVRIRLASLIGRILRTQTQA